MDTVLQRKNMVESQVRPSDVTDRRIIRAMLEVPREAFLPERTRAVAYMDEAIGLPCGRSLLAPRVLAKLIQHLDLGDGDAVLEIGCGTGYATAVLARIAPTVVAVEADPALADTARRTLAAAGVANATVHVADHAQGAAVEAPYDAILINGAVPSVPAGILDQLKDGGRLVTVIAAGPVGRAVQWRRFGGTFDQRVLFDAAAAPLPGFERKAEFVF